MFLTTRFRYYLSLVSFVICFLLTCHVQAISSGATSTASTKLPTNPQLHTTATTKVKDAKHFATTKSPIGHPTTNRQLVTTSPVSDAELQEITEELFTKNSCCLYGNITVNFQGWIKGNSTIEDQAPRPLLRISSQVFTYPTVMQMLKLLDNYELDIRRQEDNTKEEQAEEHDFINMLMATDIMTKTMNFLSNKGYFPKDQQIHKDLLKLIWFQPYSRIKRAKGSSGFEHVFLVEQKMDNTIVGLHNWIFFAKQESLNELNYLGYGRKINIANKAALARLHFNYKNKYKASVLLIGTTPELEIALYTLCFYTRPNKRCRVSFAGTKFDVQTYTWQNGNTNLVGAAFPRL